MAQEVYLHNPRHAHNALVKLALTISGPGLFWVRLYANGDMIAHRGFAVAAEPGG